MTSVDLRVVGDPDQLVEHGGAFVATVDTAQFLADVPVGGMQ